MVKKGQVLNEFGPLPIGDDLKYARKITRVEFERVANKYLFMRWEEIEPLAKSKNIPMLDFMIISLMNHAVKDGDPKRLDFLLDRLIGQVVRKIHVQTEEEHIPKTSPIAMSDEEKVEMLDIMRERILKNVESSKESASDVIEVKLSK